jgi:hypothetical protein
MATYDDYNQAPQPGGYQEQPHERGPRGSSGKALASLLLGLASFCGMCFTGVPAIVLGFMSLGDIKRSQGRMTGGGMAVTGIITGLLGSLCCTGGIGGMLWAMFVFLPQTVKPELERNLVIQQHIGTIEELSLSFEKMIEAQEKNPPAPGVTMLAFDIKGSKGKGFVVCQMRDKGGAMELIGGQLEMSNGERFDLMAGGAGEKNPPAPPK